MKRIISFTVVTCALAVAGSLIYFHSPSRQPGHLDVTRLIPAIQSYAAELRTQGRPFPAEVSLQELISRRLINASDVSAFAGMEVTINLSASGQTPQSVLMRARLTDGHELVALADGSVQEGKGASGSWIR